METKRWLGPVLILTAAALWSTGGLGIKNLALPPLAIAGWRSLFAVPILLLFIMRDMRASVAKNRAVLATAVACCLTVCLFVAANRLTTAANAILLQYTSPIWVIVLSIPLLHERPLRRDYLTAAGCLAGLLFFFVDEVTFEGLLGNAVALVSGLTMACLVVGLRFQELQGSQSSALTSVALGNLLCATVCSPWMATAFPSIGARDWQILFSLGALQIGLAYVLFSNGLRHVTALRATLLGLLEPILNPIWVALGKEEIPGMGAAIGGTIILCTVVVDAVARRRDRPAVRVEK
jgi:drug/metabolite transporter (DMT)-like permease